MKLLAVIAFLLLISPAVWAQDANDGYRKDLGFLKESLEAKYPSLYRFQTKTTIDSLFNACIRDINANTSLWEFYRTIKLIVSAIEDGHLSCSPPESLAKQIDGNNAYFPMRLYFAENKAFVDCSNLSDFPTGTEIVKINDIGIEEIRKKLFNYIVSDGKIETKKYWIVNHTFWFYYNLVYGQSDQYRVTYRNNHGQLTNASVNGASLDEISCTGLAEKTDDKLLEFDYVNSNTALLTIRTFARDELVDANLDFEGFLDWVFRDLEEKNTPSLIIDLRGNGGGKDVFGSLLYSYLTDIPFRYYERLETTEKVLQVQDHPNLGIQKPHDHRFGGKVYILIDGLSFSATSEFCTVAKNYNRAVSIGEETGGTYCGNTSGEFVEIELPYSKISVPVPTTKYTMFTTDSTNKDRGIIPDFIIKPTIQDLIAKKDVQLDFAIGLTTE